MVDAETNPREFASCGCASSSASSAGFCFPALPDLSQLPRLPLGLLLLGEERGSEKRLIVDPLRQVSHLSQPFWPQLPGLLLQQLLPLRQRLFLLVGGDEDLFDGKIVLLPDHIGTPSS